MCLICLEELRRFGKFVDIDSIYKQRAVISLGPNRSTNFRQTCAAAPSKEDCHATSTWWAFWLCLSRIALEYRNGGLQGYQRRAATKKSLQPASLVGGKAEFRKVSGNHFRTITFALISHVSTVFCFPESPEKVFFFFFSQRLLPTFFFLFL